MNGFLRVIHCTLGISLLIHALAAAYLDPTVLPAAEIRQTEGNKPLKLRLARARPPSQPAREALQQEAPEPTPQENPPERPLPKPQPAPEPEPEQQKPEVKPSPTSKPEPEKRPPQKTLEEVSPDEPHSSEQSSAETLSRPETITGEDESQVIPVTAEQVDPAQVWLSELQERINRNKIYPHIAVRRGLEGEVQMKVIIRPDGHLVSAEIISGHRVFRSPSLKALRQSLPLPPEASLTRPVTITLSLTYELD